MTQCILHRQAETCDSVCQQPEMQRGMDNITRLDEIFATYGGREGSLLPILNDIQREFGCVTEETVRHVARALNLSPAEVHGVASFYHDFRSEPASLPVVKLCRAEGCQARGSEALAAEVADASEGKCEIEPVYCLGLCSVGPNAMIGGDLHARLDRDALTQIIEAL